MPKYGVISGPYFPVFGLNTGKHGPEITPYLDTFHKVSEEIKYSSYVNTLHRQKPEKSATGNVMSVLALNCLILYYLQHGHKSHITRKGTQNFWGKCCYCTGCGKN